MPSVEQMQRLLRLEQRALEQAIGAKPKLGVFFPKLSPEQERRLIESWRAPQTTTNAQASELYAILAAGCITDILHDGEFQIRNSAGGEFLLLTALHNYARSTGSINMPFFSELLKGYVFRTLCRLFRKYGWEAGQPDCASIRPLREWAPEDSRYLIDMLDRLCVGAAIETLLVDE